MICKYCQTENVDDAVFCKQCGKRIDGNMLCPKCGGLNTDDSAYCVRCGARIDGKSRCPSCGTVFGGRFCPHCGNASAEETEKTADVVQRDEKWKNIVKLVGSVLMFLAALCSFAFVFCIGFKILDEPIGIWEYFGKAYEDIAAELELLSGYGGFFGINQYLPSILCTVAVALSLIAVVTLTVLSVVRFVRNMAGKTQKNVDRFAFATYFSYLAGVTVLLAFHYANISASGVSTELSAQISATTGLNGATCAGVALGTVFLALGLGCRVAQYGGDLKNRSVLLNVLCALAGFVCLALTWAFVARAAGGICESKLLNIGRITLKFGIYFTGMISFMAQKYDDDFYVDDVVLTPYALSLVALALGVALIVLLALIAVKRARCISEGGNSALGLSIAAFVVALAYLIISIFALKTYSDTINYFEYVGISVTEPEITFNFAPAIVCLVFATLNLALSVAQYVAASALDEPVPEEI